jgi:AmiR/NasT family two-component response regulator
MARLGIPEEEAYKLMRKTAMDQGKRIVDIAELTLALPAFIPTAH